MDISIDTLNKMVGNLPKETNHYWHISRRIECYDGGYPGSEALYFSIEHYIFKDINPLSLLRKEIQEIINNNLLLTYG